MPLVLRRLGEHCKQYTVEKGFAGIAPGAGATYLVIAHLYFDSVEAFQSAFAPHSAEIMGDIANYTNLAPLIQISEVVVA